MKCQPGELAIVTRPPAALADLRGRIVRVVTPFIGARGGSCWTLTKREGFIARCLFLAPRAGYVFSGERVWINCAEDAWLTPIRPGPEPTGKPMNEARAAIRTAHAAAHVGRSDAAATSNGDARADECARAVGRATTTRTDQQCPRSNRDTELRCAAATGGPRAPLFPSHRATS